MTNVANSIACTDGVRSTVPMEKSLPATYPIAALFQENMGLVPSVVAGHAAAKSDPLCPRPWSSLFTSLSCNAGVYTLSEFEMVNDIMMPHPSVMQAVANYWSGFLVGSF